MMSLHSIGTYFQELILLNNFYLYTQSYTFRYETRLKEVVKSYKALAKEKSVLESSLKAITDSAQEVATCSE